jgi:hypothetical protein
MANEEKNGVNLLSFSVEGLFKEAKNAVIERDEGKLDHIEKLVKRFFCKKIARYQLEEFDQFNKHMVNFLVWFEWGGIPQWDKEKVKDIVNKWKTILELSQLISRSESPRKALLELKRSPLYGERLVAMLYEKSFMRPKEIQKALKIRTIQQVSKLLSGHEKSGIIVREIVGKNVGVSLGVQGMRVYNEYIEPRLTNMSHLTIEAFKIYEKEDFQKAKEILELEKEKNPKNPLVLCLLGLINLEEGNLYEAGMLFTEAAQAVFDKISIFLFFYILEKMKRLDLLRNGIWMMNTQKDEISKQIRPSLRILGLLNEYIGETSRANQYYECSTKEG